MSSKEKARVLLVGGGGVGAMACYALESGRRAEVTVVLRSNFEAVQRNGFQIDSIEHGNGITGFRTTHIVNRVPNVVQEGLQPYNYIIVSTKNIPDVRPNVLDVIEPAITSEATIVLLQNGLNIEKPIIERYPSNVVLSGVSIISASEPSHGVIKHEFTDSAKIGVFPAVKGDREMSETRARRLVDIYNACGKVNWEYDDDVAFTRWRKLMYNASYNSVSAILGMGVVRMRMTQHIIDELIRPAMLEIRAAAKAAGIDLPDGLEDFLICLDPTDEDFLPSMGQDAAKVSPLSRVPGYP